jgi:hypothetical protein
MIERYRGWTVQTGLPDLSVPLFQLAESGFSQTQGYGSVCHRTTVSLLIFWAELHLIRVFPRGPGV